ncbi:MAG: SAM-dependent methyltransferase [Trebonia sp.]
MPGTSRLAVVVIVTGNTTKAFGIDSTVPATARMYDHWLVGHDNFAVDRKTALEVSGSAPEAPLMADARPPPATRWRVSCRRAHWQRSHCTGVTHNRYYR